MKRPKKSTKRSALVSKSNSSFGFGAQRSTPLATVHVMDMGGR